MGKYLSILSSLALIRQPLNEKENSEFKPAVWVISKIVPCYWLNLTWDNMLLKEEIDAAK